jgi:hypothetical protein
LSGIWIESKLFQGDRGPKGITQSSADSIRIPEGLAGVDVEARVRPGHYILHQLLGEDFLPIFSVGGKEKWKIALENRGAACGGRRGDREASWFDAVFDRRSRIKTFAEGESPRRMAPEGNQ